MLITYESPCDEVFPARFLRDGVLFPGDSMNAKVAEALNQVALPVVPFDTCKRADYWWFQVKTSMICCGYTLPDELSSVCQVQQDLQH